MQEDSDRWSDAISRFFAKHSSNCGTKIARVTHTSCDFEQTDDLFAGLHTFLRCRCSEFSDDGAQRRHAELPRNFDSWSLYHTLIAEA